MAARDAATEFINALDFYSGTPAVGVVEELLQARLLAPNTPTKGVYGGEMLPLEILNGEIASATEWFHKGGFEKSRLDALVDIGRLLLKFGARTDLIHDQGPLPMYQDSTDRTNSIILGAIKTWYPDYVSLILDAREVDFATMTVVPTHGWRGSSSPEISLLAHVKEKADKARSVFAIHEQQGPKHRSFLDIQEVVDLVEGAVRRAPIVKSAYKTASAQFTETEIHSALKYANGDPKAAARLLQQALLR
jgi:hypothetical protein